jgi:hypothetical protein
MFVMSLWAMVAATIVITSKTSDQILVGRVLNCVFNNSPFSPACRMFAQVTDLPQMSTLGWSWQGGPPRSG